MGLPPFKRRVLISSYQDGHALACFRYRPGANRRTDLRCAADIHAVPSMQLMRVKSPNELFSRKYMAWETRAQRAIGVIKSMSVNPSGTFDSRRSPSMLSGFARRAARECPSSKSNWIDRWDITAAASLEKTEDAVRCARASSFKLQASSSFKRQMIDVASGLRPKADIRL